MLKPLTTEFLAEVKFILGNLSDIWTLAQAETIRQGIRILTKVVLSSVVKRKGDVYVYFNYYCHKMHFE